MNTPNPGQETNNTNAHAYVRGLARWWVALSQPDNLLKKQFVCVDTDVVTMFCTPALGAGYTSLQFLGSAGKIRADSHRSAAAALAGELARFVLFELDARQRATEPRLQLPGHAEETLHNYYKTVENAARLLDRAEAELAELALLAEKIRSSLREPSNTADQAELENRLTSFVAQWLGSDTDSPAARVDAAIRFAELLSASQAQASERLAHITRYRFGAPFDQKSDGFLPDFTTMEEFARHAEHFRSALSIKPEIFKEQSARIKDPTLPPARAHGAQLKKATDAYALAAFTTVNEMALEYAVARHCPPGRHEYLALISGAERLQRLCKGSVVDPLHLVPRLLKQLFGNEHLEWKRNLSDLIGGILEPIHDILGRNTRTFEKWCEAVAMGNTSSIPKSVEFDLDKLAEVEEAWERMCLAIAARSTGSESMLDKIRKLAGKGEQVLDNELWLAKLQDILFSAKRALIGKIRDLNPSLNFNTRPLSRNPPPLGLEDFPDAKKIADQTVWAVSHNAGKQHLKQCMGEFPSNAAQANPYLLTLLVGITEAAAGNWKLAKLILWAAYQNGKECLDKRITGRDAAYALAIACRITARRTTAEDDLAQAERYVLEAHELDVEKDSRPYRDVRFDAEDLAIRLSRVWYLTTQPETSKSDAAPRMNFRAEAIAVAEESLRLLDGDSLKDKTDTYTKYFVAQQLYCTLFQAWWLAQYAAFNGVLFKPMEDVGSSISPGDLSRATQDFLTLLQTLECNDNNNPPPLRPIITPLSRVISFLAELEFGSNDAPHRRKRLGEVVKLCDDPITRTFDLIDDQRYSFLKLLLERQITP